MISRPSFFLGCFALLIFLVVTTEVDARGRGGASARGFSRSGPASGGSVRSARQAGRVDRARPSGDARERRRDIGDDRRDRQQERYEDRRDYRQDRYEDRRDFRKDVYDDRRDRYEDRWRWRVGTTLTVSTFRSLSCRREIIIVGNVTYYRCGGAWYSQAYQGGSVTYVIVNPPSGY